MSRKWEDLRDEYLDTPAKRASYIRAKHKLDRHLRYYAHWQAVCRRLGLRRRDQ